MKGLHFIKVFLKIQVYWNLRMWLTWRWGLGPCSQLRWGHPGPRRVLHPILKASHEERQKQGHIGRRPYDKGARGWKDASSSQGLPRVTSCHQKLGRGMRHFSLQVSSRNDLASTLISPASLQTHERINRSCSSHPVCRTICGSPGKPTRDPNPPITQPFTSYCADAEAGKGPQCRSQIFTTPRSPCCMTSKCPLHLLRELCANTYYFYLPSLNSKGL